MTIDPEEIAELEEQVAINRENEELEYWNALGWEDDE
jgi:hypothetical protein